MSKAYLADKTVFFVTLGCKVNQTESEAVAQMFREAGYTVADRGEEAGVVVVNTCTVTNNGDAKSRQTIRRMVNAHPDSFVIVMGCYAQTSPGDIMGIDGVDLVLGTQDRGKILDWIEQVKQEQSPYNAVHEIRQANEFEELPQLEGESRTRATLKIEEGCDQYCTYCIIPYARGPVRSRTPENALAEAGRLVESGFQEIVLTGIHLGAYGKDLVRPDGVWTLARLAAWIAEIPGLRRLRISSIEPMEVSDELIALLQTSKVLCPHLHIPLQSGSDAILARMHRPYTLAQYKEKLEILYDAIPGLAVTTDVIAGFPGETEENHREAVEFIRSCCFAGMHVFPYSRRQGTPAARYPDQLVRRVKEERVKELMAVGEAGKQTYARRFLGQTLDVLIETVGEDGSAYGHTPNYLEVRLPSGAKGDKKKSVSVRLEEQLLVCLNKIMK